MVTRLLANKDHNSKKSVKLKHKTCQQRTLQCNQQFGLKFMKQSNIALVAFLNL